MPVPRNLLPFNTRPYFPQLVRRFIKFPHSSSSRLCRDPTEAQPPTFSPYVRERDQRSHEPSECLSTLLPTVFVDT